MGLNWTRLFFILFRYKCFQYAPLWFGISSNKALFLLLLQKIKEISPQQQSIGYLKPTWIGFRLPNSQPPATLQFLCIYSTIYLQLASLSGPMVLGGLGRLRMTSLASWDFSTILSFNLTAVCIRRTLEDSLKKKAIPFSLISSQVQVLLKYERKSIFLIHKQYSMSKNDPYLDLFCGTVRELPNELPGVLAVSWKEKWEFEIGFFLKFHVWNILLIL